jgi:hypothetical protein
MPDIMTITEVITVTAATVVITEEMADMGDTVAALAGMAAQLTGYQGSRRI